MIKRNSLFSQMFHVKHHKPQRLQETLNDSSDYQKRQAVRCLEHLPPARTGQQRPRRDVSRSRAPHGNPVGNEYPERRLRCGGREVRTADRLSSGNELQIPVVPEVVSLRGLAVRIQELQRRRCVRWTAHSVARLCRRAEGPDFRGDQLGQRCTPQRQIAQNTRIPLSRWSIHPRFDRGGY